MLKILKSLNKFNGNICFAAESDYGYCVFECDRLNKTLDYSLSTKQTSGICLYTATSYLIAFSDNWLGLYENGTLNETYYDLSAYGISYCHNIIRINDEDYFILDRTNNTLIKFKWDDSITWSLVLPDVDRKYYGDICYRDADGYVVYFNNKNIHLIRDDTTSGTLFNSLTIDSSSGLLNVALGGEYRPSFTYARAEEIELDASSSSSSESSMSFSSSSSSSYVLNWSSSSSSE